MKTPNYNVSRRRLTTEKRRAAPLPHRQAEAPCSQHRTLRPSPCGASSGGSTLHRSMTRGQRGWNAQPEGTFAGLGTSPGMAARVALADGSATGAEAINPANKGSLARPDGQGAGSSFVRPGDGEASLPGSGAAHALDAGQEDQSGTALGGTRPQGEANGTVFRYILIGLTLSGLAFIFFLVIMPKTKQRREQ